MVSSLAEPLTMASTVEFQSSEPSFKTEESYCPRLCDGLEGKGKWRTPWWSSAGMNPDLDGAMARSFELLKPDPKT